MNNTNAQRSATKVSFCDNNVQITSDKVLIQFKIEHIKETICSNTTNIRSNITNKLGKLLVIRQNKLKQDNFASTMGH